MEFIYPTVHYAIFVHDEIIAISGGRSGVLNAGALGSIIHHIKNDDYYPEFEDKLTHLLFEINKGHCFNDGNKRTSIALATFFMEINGLDALVNKFIINMENIAVYVASNKVNKCLLKEIVISLLTEDDFSEELKITLWHALSE